MCLQEPPVPLVPSLSPVGQLGAVAEAHPPIAACCVSAEGLRVWSLSPPAPWVGRPSHHLLFPDQLHQTQASGVNASVPVAPHLTPTSVLIVQRLIILHSYRFPAESILSWNILFCFGRTDRLAGA